MNIVGNFKTIKNAVRGQLDKMIKNGELFYVELDKDKLYEIYLSSFPEGTNPIHKTRTEHDCTCCKQFIRNAGNIVTFKDGQLVSIWDVTADEVYQPVADAMSAFVKQHPVANIYRHFEKNLGADVTRQQLEDFKIINWDHFHYILPDKFVVGKRGAVSIDKLKGDARTNKEVLESSLKAITKDALSVVMDLIDQNSLYRGMEFKMPVVRLVAMLNEYNNVLKTNLQREEFLWKKSLELGDASKIKNTVIGTLLLDLSNGVDLEDAVRMFEAKVAPQNYKRPTALVTKAMVDKAEKKVVELGIADSLLRRYAKATDITINNVLYADRSTKKAMGGAFDSLRAELKDKTPSLDKVQEVTIDEFISKILPTAASLELMVENPHVNNFMSLIAPQYPDAPRIMKWNNNFSWSYNGEVTDSIKERVKKAGGKVDGDLRVSLSWFNYDDLDLHAYEPNGNHIYYANKRSTYTDGCLDVDMNAGTGKTREAVENIVWASKAKLKEGPYKVTVRNFRKRESEDVGFQVEMEFGGKLYTFTHEKAVKDGDEVEVVAFNYSKSEGIKIIRSLPCTELAKDIWGVTTQKFYKVSMVMTSPNYWDDQEIGNKHYFFVLEGCKNPGQSRGFYNEFLTNDLMEHRKVFELLSSKMKVEPSDDQLSGLGFSSTQPNSVLCKVSGSFNRMIKIKF